MKLMLDPKMPDVNSHLKARNKRAKVALCSLAVCCQRADFGPNWDSDRRTNGEKEIFPKVVT